MKRMYNLQHNTIVEEFFNNSHDFEKWYRDISIIRDFIHKEYEKVCCVTGKDSGYAEERINICALEKNGFNYIVIDFGECEQAGMCCKVILSNYRKPHYFTVERGGDYLYYLCEWTRGIHKKYFSVINDTDYIVERISASIMKK